MAITVCKNCGNQFDGKYCNACGAKVYAEKDKSLGNILHEALHFFTHLDNKFFKTIRVIFGHPGLLSITYCNGNRSKYYKPFSLFFIGVLLYLLFPFLPGLNMSFNANLLNFQAQGMSFVTKIAEQKVFSHGIAMEELAKRYDAKSSGFAKILLLIILPLTGIALKMLFYRRKKYFYDHLILATEASCISLYLIFFILPIIFYLLRAVVKLSDATWLTVTGDLITMPAIALYLVVWSVAAFRKFYNITFMHALLKGILFLILHFFIIYVLYKLILFLTILLFI